MMPSRRIGSHQVSFTLALVLLSSLVCTAQQHQQDSGKAYKNIIRFNLSNFILFGPGNIIMGYERLVSPTQSFSINIGHAALPRLTAIITDSLSINNQEDKAGVNISADYRFYLRKENKHHAPHGLYIGPYMMYNKTQKSTTWDLVHPNGVDQVNIETNFSVLGAGFELGYQFVFLKRITLDLVLTGPGLARYTINAKFDSTLDPKDREQLFQALEQAIENRYPGMSVVMQDKEFNAEGRLRTTNLGYRYLIQVGFRF